MCSVEVGSRHQTWVDPIVDRRPLWFLSTRWAIVLPGDIGGFGMGSDFRWLVTGVIGYNCRLLGDDNARFFSGYRALSQDYDVGSGSNKFEWDVTLQGPVFGLSYHCCEACRGNRMKATASNLDGR